MNLTYNYIVKTVLIVGLLLVPVVSEARDLALAQPVVRNHAGIPAPWSMRKPSPASKLPHPRGEGLIDLGQWPAEPASPAVAGERLAAALQQVCHGLPLANAENYATWMVTYGESFDVDPFLLAALVYDQSHCGKRRAKGHRFGLTAIDLGMHRSYVKDGQYHYWLRDTRGTWQEKTLDVSQFAFTPAELQRPQPNIYFAAAILAVFQKQCRHIDGTFGSIEHRHPVGHWVWGDRVRDNREEDHILRARRQLISAYIGQQKEPVGNFRGLVLHSPLGAWPRKVTSGLGDPRSNGRRHRGIDFDSRIGEPVYAVAEGKVILAGVDMRVGPGKNLPVSRARRVPLSEMGPGGLIVIVQHEGGLTSGYMHLSRYLVKRGDRVKAGSLIGYVGRSGIRVSAAHLHFELRHDGRHLNPLAHLGPMVFPPEATYAGRRALAQRRHARRQARRQHLLSAHSKHPAPQKQSSGT